MIRNLLGFNRFPATGRFQSLVRVECLLFLLWGCASSPASLPPNSAEGFYHQVGKGQTLWKIAQIYGVNPELLARANALGNPDQLHVGQRLWVPQGKELRRRGAGTSTSRNPRVLKANRTPEVSRREETTSVQRGTPSPKAHGVPEGKKVGPPSLQDRERELGGREEDFRWPVRGEVVRHFEVDLKAGKRHQGIDIAAVLGSPVVASLAGQVIFSGEGPGKYGKMVIIDHLNGFVTVYAYNQENLVVKDQTVAQGEAVARVGEREGLFGPALHFEIRKGAVAYDPLRFLSLSDISPLAPIPKPLPRPLQPEKVGEKGEFPDRPLETSPKVSEGLPEAQSHQATP